MKPNLSYVFALSFFVFASTSAPLAAQAMPAAKDGNSQVQPRVGHEAPHGYESAGTPDRAIKLGTGKTRSVRVHRLETVRIVDGERSITWTFDTLGLPLIPLSKLLPGAADITIYVEENPMYAN